MQTVRMDRGRLGQRVGLDDLDLFLLVGNERRSGRGGVNAWCRIPPDLGGLQREVRDLWAKLRGGQVEHAGAAIGR